MTAEKLFLKHNPGNAVFASEQEFLVYCLPTDRLERLNSSAALLYELCDGTRTREGVLKLLTDTGVRIDSGELLHHRTWLDQAVESQLLLKSVSPSNAGIPPGSSTNLDSFTRQAQQLRDEGAILAAFVCQAQACNLAPDEASCWLELGELAHILGRRDDAREAYSRYLELQPDNAKARHILHALNDQTPPDRAPDDCIRQLYARFSSFYEDNMCDDLGYEAPQRLQELLSQHFSDTGHLEILELGCGTGLAGKVLKPYASRLTGVDLSPEMIERCRVTGLYDELAVAEITGYLLQAITDSCRFDLIAACDTLIYFGDLNQVFISAVQLLAPGGSLAFTVEKGADNDFTLTDSGRYSHSETYLRSLAAKAELQVIELREGFLRYEYGEPVSGYIVLLSKSEGSQGRF